jgi:hypothetical protein
MAHARRISGVALEISMGQAKFLYDLLQRHVAGDGFHNTENKEILEALKEVNINCDRMSASDTVIIYDKEYKDV